MPQTILFQLCKCETLQFYVKLLGFGLLVRQDKTSEDDTLNFGELRHSFFTIDYSIMKIMSSCSPIYNNYIST